MLHQVKRYLIHRWKSVHLHGIHSPFIFEFNRDCLQDSTDFDAYEEIARFRESVKNHPQKLQIKDHGAGSKLMNDHTRHTSEILLNNCSSVPRSRLLYRIATYFNARNVLELGTSLGIGSCVLALGSDNLITIEGSPAVARYAQERLEQFKSLHIKVLIGTFDQFLSGRLSSKPQGVYDLIFIDGHHDGPATIDYLQRLLPYCTDSTVVIIDDIHWSPGMSKAWEQLQHHPKVTASIDTFQWGILFFRKEQRQQSFYIKL